MSTIAILGAGETGATLARRLAETGRFAAIWLVDEDEGRARGKALDLAQSGPIEGYDTEVRGTDRLDKLPEVAALVVAEPAGIPQGSLGLGPPDSFVASLVRAVGRGFLLDAQARAAPLVASAVRAGLPRTRVAGSAPLASAGAVRTRLAEELGAAPRDVALTVLGLPPDRWVLPGGTATLGGVPILRLAPLAERRALAAVRGRVPGPVALATAAARVLVAVFAPTASVLPVFAALDGEYGHRRTALAVPARLARGRVEVIEVPLDPVDRSAFDTLAEQVGALAR
jgi:malate dehydrogenase